ncbi:L-lactate dehydrogenase [Phaeosphaeria sp. MPI-PUGE-AT-0046c]|nr:L-lactate dehydrogenase [Phaeosphaeria sp. MPI-PUGE-AT-0046c]
MIDGAEVQQHNSAESCWIVVHGRAYDVTEFLDEHPGGAPIILKCAGYDATDAYEAIHSPDLITETLPSSACLGLVEANTVAKMTPPSAQIPDTNHTEGSKQSDIIINVNDFEMAAEKCATGAAWAFMASAADDEITKVRNAKDFAKISLRPRVMRNVATVDTSTTILGFPTSMPVFVSPTGLNKLAHPNGECEVTIAVGKAGWIQVVSTVSSQPIEKVMAARVDTKQPIFFQLYVNKDITKTQALLRKVKALGVSSIWVTVDTPVLGKRERDEKLKAKENGTGSGLVGHGNGRRGVAKDVSSWFANSLQWEDLQWIRAISGLPVVVKGVQCVEDAVLAYQHGADGILISNHGGRSQDTSQSTILTLLEIRHFAPHLINSKMEIYLDGGVRRGTDVLKALALGATAVGMGRPFLHALTVGGAPAIEHMMNLVATELQTNMALLGATKISEVVPEMLNTKRLERNLVGAVKL